MPLPELIGDREADYYTEKARSSGFIMPNYPILVLGILAVEAVAGFFGRFAYAADQFVSKWNPKTKKMDRFVIYSTSGKPNPSILIMKNRDTGEKTKLRVTGIQRDSGYRRHGSPRTTTTPKKDPEREALETKLKHMQLIAHYRASLKHNPNNPGLYLKIAELYITIDDYANAILAGRKATETKPKKPAKEGAEPYYDVGIKFYRHKDYDAAMQLMKEVIRLGKEGVGPIKRIAWAYNIASRIHQAKGDHKKSLEVALEGYKINRRVLRDRIFLCYERLGNKEMMRRAVQLEDLQQN